MTEASPHRICPACGGAGTVIRSSQFYTRAARCDTCRGQLDTNIDGGKLMSRLLTYLACPYSDSDPSVRAQRFHDVNHAAATLMRAGHKVYSPISHTHPITLAGDLPRGWDFWQEYDRVFLGMSGLVIVLTLDGWQRSVGIKGEIEIAESLRVPVIYRTPEEIVAYTPLPIPS